MNAALRLALALPAVFPLAGGAQLQLLPAPQPAQVFAGTNRRIELTWHNAGDQPIEAELRHKLYQASSATAAPLGEAPWKRLQILPHQTLLELAMLDFPAVRTESRFLVQWIEGSNTVVGITDLLVYPTNLLSELGTLAGDAPIAVLDPGNELKPLLALLNIEFTDLEASHVGGYRGKLIIARPFRSGGQMRNGLALQLAAAARKGAGVVWIQPPRNRREKLMPSFYAVAEGTGAVVVAEDALVSDLAGNPQSQINLVHLARRALHPEPPCLPLALR